MDEIEEFERRILAAFDRIAAGVSVVTQLPDAPLPVAGSGGDAGEIAALREALEAERTANAQLTERVRAIREKQETVIATLERNLARVTQQLDAQGRELTRQRKLNDHLARMNGELVAAARAGVTEPHLLNKAMMTELEALRASRAAEIAEMDEILSELKPLIGEVA
jgi:hypothetical protein